MAFTDIQFEGACKELLAPQFDGWEFFVESNDVTIYRLYNETSGLYEYKVYGYMRDVLPETCAKVYMDAEYRKTWDDYVKNLDLKMINNQEVLYWNVNYPFPMSNRDYVYTRELREMESQGHQMWIVMAKSIEVPDYPPVSGAIRVSDYFQSAALMTDGESGTKAFMHYYDNPGGMIPTFLINWAAKTGVPQFLTVMQKACRGYDDYLKTCKQKQSS